MAKSSIIGWLFIRTVSNMDPPPLNRELSAHSQLLLQISDGGIETLQTMKITQLLQCEANCHVEVLQATSLWL